MRRPRARPADSRRALASKITRAASIVDRQGYNFSGHADRYDNDFEYCYQQSFLKFYRV